MCCLFPVSILWCCLLLFYLLSVQFISIFFFQCTVYFYFLFSVCSLFLICLLSAVHFEFFFSVCCLYLRSLHYVLFISTFSNLSSLCTGSSLRSGKTAPHKHGPLQRFLSLNFLLYICGTTNITCILKTSASLPDKVSPLILDRLAGSSPGRTAWNWGCFMSKVSI